ncbi:MULTISPECIES: nSTAND1 domain-containing NTPase [Niastella]|uniref:Novel STAND NTPase 1 domain-containing protein n=1 Tax=Niastella soli TaxID=2821487 RepID=A0ABS3Z110_9BACT|nr:hypothetical protein [Niastella soli]MBO9203854.1 hypothetical protein [Niastella soli]
MSIESLGVAKRVSLDRYPGIRPFRKEEAALFFGRNSEVEELLHSVKVHDLLVLYSKSGLGKSSLVNAGLSPRLLEENVLPIDIRFLTSAEKSPYRKILNEVKSWIPKDVIGEMPEALQNDLWAIFSQWQRPETPILIFDQFEEFFYYDRLLQEEVITHLSYIMSTKIPDQVINKLINSTFRDENKKQDYLTKPPVKMLFLIRSDRLSLLGDLSIKLPQILSNRYHLKPLGVQKAEQAISMPAQLMNNEVIEFNTNPYEYSLASLKIILTTLSNKDNEIESSQLQIVCQELEKIAERKRGNYDGEIVIEPDDFGGERGIKKIINDFYWNQLKKLQTNEKLQLSDGDIKVVRNLIENELLSGNKRIIQSAARVNEILCKTNPNKVKIDDVDKEVYLTDELLKLRLIRDEESHLGKVFEISHDTLVESIVEAREERKKKEQAEQLMQKNKELEEEKRRVEKEIRLKEKARTEREKALAAEQNAIEAERKALHAKAEAESAWQIAIEEERNAVSEKNKVLKTRKRLRIVLVIMAILLITVLGLLFYANNNRIENKFRNATGRINTGNYEEAKRELGFAKGSSGFFWWLINWPALDRYRLLNAKIDTLIKHSRQYETLLQLAARYQTEKGDSLYYAYGLYHQAARLGFTPANSEKSIGLLLKQLKMDMGASYNRYVDKAEAFWAAGAVNETKYALNIAESLLVDNFLVPAKYYHDKYSNLKKELEHK